jgi:hypothetical protein
VQIELGKLLAMAHAWRAGQECVVMYPMTVAASELCVQVGVGVVFGGTPQVVLRVPDQRSPLVPAQETGHPPDVVGRRQVSHAGVLRSGWPGCCARLARRGNARAASGVPSELEDRLLRPDGAARCSFSTTGYRVLAVSTSFVCGTRKVTLSPGRTRSLQTSLSYTRGTGGTVD